MSAPLTKCRCVPPGSEMASRRGSWTIFTDCPTHGAQTIITYDPTNGTQTSISTLAAPLAPEVVDLLNAAYEMAAEVAGTPSPGIPYTPRENALMAAGEMWDRAGRPGLPLEKE